MHQLLADLNQFGNAATLQHCTAACTLQCGREYAGGCRPLSERQPTATPASCACQLLCASEGKQLVNAGEHQRQLPVPDSWPARELSSAIPVADAILEAHPCWRLHCLHTWRSSICHHCLGAPKVSVHLAMYSSSLGGLRFITASHECVLPLQILDIYMGCRLTAQSLLHWPEPMPVPVPVASSPLQLHSHMHEGFGDSSVHGHSPAGLCMA